MTYQEIEQIKDATYTQTIRGGDDLDQCSRDFARASCLALGDVLQRIQLAEKSYRASFSDELKVAMLEDLLSFIKGDIEYSFGYFAAKCEEYGKRRGETEWTDKARSSMI